MKQLSQDVLDALDAPYWTKSVAINGFGQIVLLSVDSSMAYPEGNCWKTSVPTCFKQVRGSGYDTTDWQKSIIDKTD